MVVEIRRAKESDCEAVLKVLRAAFEPYRTHYSPGAYTDTVLTANSFIPRLSTMAIFVAVTASGEIVGTIACNLVTSDEGHLRGMAVLPAFQGVGVAQRLLEAAEAELYAAGCSYITLDTTDPLVRAIHFYTKHGYRSTDRVQDFFGMPLHEFRKDLSPKKE